MPVPASTRPSRAEMRRKIEVFKALLAGSRIDKVSNDFNITLRFVKETYSEIITLLAVQAERSIDVPFPHRGAIYELNGENPKGPCKRIRIEGLTIPRVRKHEEYWLQMLEDAKLL